MIKINPTLIEQIGKSNQPAYETAPLEIDPKEHAINDISKRKVLTVYRRILDHNGEPLLDSNGKEMKKSEPIDPTRIALPLQDIIATRRVAFMNLGKVKLFCEPDGNDQIRAFNLLNRLRENNKLQFKEPTVAEILQKELQVAKLWYSVDADDASHWGGYSSVKKDFRVQILAPSKGDTLLPVFDDAGKLVYFGRGYKRKKSIQELMVSDDAVVADLENEITCLDVYSKDALYKFEQSSLAVEGGWMFIGKIPLPYGKIPIIYYSKKEPIWAPVQVLIERLETALSDFAETNIYNASPTLVFKNVDGAQAQERGENRKAVLLKGDKAGAEYVTWDQAVDATKLEIDTLVNFIYSLTQTPNISFEEMKNLGAQSGVAWDRVFIDAHLAARREKEGEYGEMIQRDINLQKSLLASMDTTIRPHIEAISVTYEAPDFKLDDLDADVDLAIKAKEGGLISQETAIGISGLVTNVQEEITRIKEDTQYSRVQQ